MGVSIASRNRVVTRITVKRVIARAFELFGRGYNGGMVMRLALDARKLTDFGIGTYLSHLLRGLDARPDLELTVAGAGRDTRTGWRSWRPSAGSSRCRRRGYGLAEHLRLPAVLWRERVDLVHFPHYVVPRVDAAAGRWSRFTT